MTKTQAKGFTLIELAIVIAIIAILSAAAIPRFGNLTRSAETALIQDFVSQLNSAAAAYTAENARVPLGFTSFVAATPAQVGTPVPPAFGGGFFTIAPPVSADGTRVYCPTVTATRIRCSNFTAPNNDVVYAWANGRITVAGIG